MLKEKGGKVFSFNDKFNDSSCHAKEGLKILRDSIFVTASALAFKVFQPSTNAQDTVFFVSDSNWKTIQNSPWLFNSRSLLLP